MNGDSCMDSAVDASCEVINMTGDTSSSASKGAAALYCAVAGIDPSRFSTPCKVDVAKFAHHFIEEEAEEGGGSQSTYFCSSANSYSAQSESNMTEESRAFYDA